MRSPPEPTPRVLVVRGRIACSDVAGLCERLRVVLEGSDAPVVVCDVGALVVPDAVAVGALARLQLTARRLGHEVRLRQPSPALLDLLDFTGLSAVLPLAELDLGPVGKAEQREEARRVEEGVDRRDPAV